MMKTKLFIAALCVAAFGLTTQAQTNLTTAVDFTVTDTHGDTHNLFEYLNDGKYVCIDFFAYWCGPCQTTSPQFNEVYHMYGCNSGDVIFLSLEYEGTEAQTIEFEEAWAGENPPPAASGIDGGAAQPHADYGIEAFPTFILIDPDHNIVEQDIWPMSTAILDAKLAEYGLEHAECSVSVKETTATADTFTMYPNPTTNEVSINGGDEAYSLTIHNVLGAEIMKLNGLTGRQSVSTTDLEAGNYVVTVTNSGGSTTQTLSVLK